MYLNENKIKVWNHGTKINRRPWEIGAGILKQEKSIYPLLFLTLLFHLKMKECLQSHWELKIKSTTPKTYTNFMPLLLRIVRSTPTMIENAPTSIAHPLFSPSGPIFPYNKMCSFLLLGCHSINDSKILHLKAYPICTSPSQRRHRHSKAT